MGSNPGVIREGNHSRMFWETDKAGLESQMRISVAHHHHKARSTDIVIHLSAALAVTTTVSTDGIVELALLAI